MEEERGTVKNLSQNAVDIGGYKMGRVSGLGIIRNEG